MRYDDPDLPDLLTTTQVFEIAENMRDWEDIIVETPITQFLRLQVSMMNRPLEDVDAYLDVEEVEGMQVSIPVEAYYRGKESPRFYACVASCSTICSIATKISLSVARCHDGKSSQSAT
jgi:hypothetical protein